MIFLDEAGLTVKMTRLYARAYKGERVVDFVPGHWGTNLTVTGALSLQGPMALMTLKGALDGDAFKVYVKDCLLPNLKPGHVVVMDNLSVHKINGIRELIESKGARLLYLPPYHPDLNPIEKLWSKIKTLLRSAKARTHEALENALSNAINRIYTSDAKAWFKCCGY